MGGMLWRQTNVYRTPFYNCSLNKPSLQEYGNISVYKVSSPKEGCNPHRIA
jgi:hypothetical protein